MALPELVYISSVIHGTSILIHGQWRHLVNGCSTCNQSVAYSAHAETNPIVFISHIIAPRHMVDNEITSNRCRQIRLCNRSLDGDILQLQNGGRPSDVANIY